MEGSLSHLRETKVPTHRRQTAATETEQLPEDDKKLRRKTEIKLWEAFD